MFIVDEIIQIAVALLKIEQITTKYTLMLPSHKIDQAYA